jgi:hypothetical protein
MGILVINLELTEEGLFSHTENLDTSQSHLDCRVYSRHQRLMSMAPIKWCNGWSDGTPLQ